MSNDYVQWLFLFGECPMTSPFRFSLIYLDTNLASEWPWLCPILHYAFSELASSSKFCLHQCDRQIYHHTCLSFNHNTRLQFQSHFPSVIFPLFTGRFFHPCSFNRISLDAIFLATKVITELLTGRCCPATWVPDSEAFPQCNVFHLFLFHFIYCL